MEILQKIIIIVIVIIVTILISKREDDIMEKRELHTVWSFYFKIKIISWKQLIIRASYFTEKTLFLNMLAM